MIKWAAICAQTSAITTLKISLGENWHLHRCGSLTGDADRLTPQIFYMKKFVFASLFMLTHTNFRRKQFINDRDNSNIATAEQKKWNVFEKLFICMLICYSQYSIERLHGAAPHEHICVHQVRYIMHAASTVFSRCHAKMFILINCLAALCFHFFFSAQSSVSQSELFKKGLGFLIKYNNMKLMKSKYFYSKAHEIYGAMECYHLPYITTARPHSSH